MSAHKYTSLKYIIDRAQHVLLVAHSRPDPDTIGANIALYNYLKARNIPVTLTCTDTFPQNFESFLPDYTITNLEEIDFDAIDVVIGADNIDRGFDRILHHIDQERHVTVGIDHHPHTHLHPDLLITDPKASSTCEIIFDFFTHIKHTPNTEQANALAIGILGDTRLFHNPNTSAHVLEVTASLMDAHVPLSSIIKKAFLSKRLATLQIWGAALKNARRLTPSGAIVSVIAHKHIVGKNIPQEELKEELKEVASLLCSVPHAPFALVLIQIEEGTIKGSIRSEKKSNVDTSAIAQMFGGGGHRLASGFEMSGTLTRSGNSWRVS